jgi:hypothetical protein
VATLNSGDEEHVPPRAFTFQLPRRRRRSYVVPWARLDPAKTYEAGVSLLSRDGLATATEAVELAPADPGWWAIARGELGAAWTWLRDLVHRAR